MTASEIREIAAVITAAGAFLTSLGTLINSLRNSGKLTANSDKLDILHASTTQMVSRATDEAYTAGQKDSIDFIQKAAADLQPNTSPPRQTLGQAVAADRAMKKP
jgi:hypothetical protein